MVGSSDVVVASAPVTEALPREDIVALEMMASLNWDANRLLNEVGNTAADEQNADKLDAPSMGYSLFPAQYSEAQSSSKSYKVL